MKITLSLIKADVGAIGGHTKPSKPVLDAVKAHVKEHGKAFLIDWRVFHTGDDIALLLSHKLGIDSKQVHKLAWDAFWAGTKMAKKQGLYGAGQDLLKNSFSGNIKGLGPGVAEMEFSERENEAITAFAMDKTDPGAFNLPLYLAFADPMWSPGLLVSPDVGKGFTFHIVDMNHHKADKVVKLNAPEDLYDIASLLRETGRYAITSIYSRAFPKEQSATVSTTRLKYIAGKYVGKDDPVALVRTQKIFPATEEMGGCFRLGHFVAGDTRGSHNQPLMPVKMNSPASVHYCIPLVQGVTFAIKNGIISEFFDVFDEPFWDHVRAQVSEKSIAMRQQGFFEPGMLPYYELEYGGIVERLKKLEKRFKIKK